MYPTISDLLRDLFGIDTSLPIQTFGFFVAIAFLLASWLLALELRRKESEGLLKVGKRKVLKGKPATTRELFVQAVIGFVIGYKLLFIIFNYDAFVEDPQSGMLSLQGSFVGGIIGAAIAAWLKHRATAGNKNTKPEWVEEQVRPEDHVGNITIIAAIAGLIGAKIFHNLENLDEFSADPIGALFSFSGLTMYGGLIAGAAAVIWYARKHELALPHLIDAVAPALMLAYGVGRIGCQLAGDGDWGIVNQNPVPEFLSFLPDWVWAYDYPHNVINEGVPIEGCTGKHCFVLPEPVYPTPLYESAACILLFGVLWGIRKRIVIPGILFSIYLIMNGVERFLIEKIRVNTTYNIFGNEITQAEIISVVLVILGIAGIWFFRKQYRDKPVSTVS